MISPIPYPFRYAFPLGFMMTYSALMALEESSASLLRIFDKWMASAPYNVGIDTPSIATTPITPQSTRVALIADFAGAVCAGVQVAMKRHSKEKA